MISFTNLPTSTYSVNNSHWLKSVLIIIGLMFSSAIFGAYPSIDPLNDAKIICDGVPLTFEITDYDPHWTFVVKSTQGVIFNNPMNQVGSTLEFDVNAINGPEDYGWADIEANNGKSSNILRVYFVQCCGNFNPDFIFVEKEASQLSLGNVISNASIKIYGTFSADIDFDFISCNIELGSNADIKLDQGTSVSIVSSTLTNMCNYRWNGIYATYANNFLEVRDTRIENSMWGIYLENNAVSEIVHNSFMNNIISTYILNYTQAGSYYNDSYLSIYKNEYNTNRTSQYYPIHTSFLATYTSTVSDIGICAETHGIYPHQMYIVVNNSRFVNVGLAGSENKNKFIGIGPNFQDGSFIVTQHSQVSIVNGEFIDGDHAICGYESELLVGGNPNDGNRFEANFSSFTKTSLEFTFNDAVDAEFTAHEPSHYNIPITGKIGNYVNNNTFLRGSFYINGKKCSSYHLIEQNIFFNTPITFDGIVADNDLHFVLYNNKIRGDYDIDENKFLISVDSCLYNSGIEHSIAENEIRHVAYQPYPPYQYVLQWSNGLKVSNSTHLMIGGNDFKCFKKAIQFNNNCSNTQFYCNVFSDNIIGIDLNSFPTMTDQGNASFGANNKWFESGNIGFTYTKRINGSFQLGSAIKYLFASTLGNNYNPDNGPGSTNGGFGVNNTGGINCRSYVTNKTDVEVNDGLHQNEFKAYPNPVKKNGTLHIASNRKEGKYYLFDMQGKLLKQGNFTQETFSIELNQLLPGSYYMQLASAVETSTLKFVIVE